jgi:hypothetical protein
MSNPIYAVLPDGWHFYVTNDYSNAEGQAFTDQRYWYGPYKSSDEALRQVRRLRLAN